MIETLKQTALKALAALTEAGADKGLCSVQYKITHEFNVDGGEFSLFRTLFDKQLKLNAVAGGRKGTVTQNRYDDETLRSAAATCLSAAESAEPDENWDFAPMAENTDVTRGATDPDLDRLFFRCKELLEQVKERFPKVMIEQFVVSHEEIFHVVADTCGVLHSTHEGSYTLIMMYSGHEGDRASSFMISTAQTADLDRPLIELASIEHDLASAEKQIDTVNPSGKFEGTMVLTPDCVSDLLGSLLMQFAGEDGLLNGTSPWKDKLHQPVADERITIGLAPLDERIVCGKRVTEEGFVAENFDIIHNGRLNAFALGLYAANKLHLPRGKNDSYNMVMAPGDKPLDEIIASIDRGILVGRFSGGKPASNGDFSGVAKNSFLIENGKVGAALSETMISGNLADMLFRLRGVSAEQVQSGYTVLPYAAFDGITISGK
ncbi:MAG: TldD/PmbA family protein [Clostridia bacterium]|nr:TldD/PmbA family protein [Clostridia bacterium]